MGPHRIAVLVASAGCTLALVAACGASPTPPTSGADAPIPAASEALFPSASTRTSPAPSDDATPAGSASTARPSPGASAWTDEAAIQSLAKDCKWNPDGCFTWLSEMAGHSIEGIERTRPECMEFEGMACARVPGQTCVPDGCSQSDYDCIPECNGGCNGCSAECVTRCESCKAPCKDDACRLACAEKCGACRQKCLVQLDHCTSAHCADVQEECFRTRDDRWNASTCEKVCPSVSACVEKCPRDENDFMGEVYGSPCASACRRRLGKGCPDEFARICAGDPNASINFNVYHETRKASPR